jgi:hypothetical protein
MYSVCTVECRSKSHVVEHEFFDCEARTDCFEQDHELRLDARALRIRS